MGIYNYSEAEKVLLTAQMLHELFMTLTDVDTVILTRNNGSVSVSLEQRTQIANNAGVDMFHSLHSDAGPPTCSSTLFLYGSLLNGSEKTPRGG
ncbi:N-acetylmuramoyl-L-alanine amidase, partial [Arthrospira platensis SPKY1]|nr:N-acetylmuramoyl-L-alanine amidase [Arthrospira platensis SPKY1]